MTCYYYYQPRQLNKILQELERDPDITGPDVAKKIHILQAIQWLGPAWDEVSAETITKCFKKSGFTSPVGDTNTEAEQSVIGIATEAEQSGAVPPAMQHLCRDLYDCDFEELASVDESLATCNTEATDWSQDATQLLKTDNESGEESNDEEEAIITKKSSIKNMTAALVALEDLKLFLAEKDNRGDMLNKAYALEDAMSIGWYESTMSAKQTKMNEFFSLFSKK